MSLLLRIILLPFVLIWSLSQFLLRLYLLTLLSAIVVIPIGYALGPVFYIAETTPRTIIEGLALLIYIPMAIAGLFIIFDHWLPGAPDRSSAPKAPSLLQLQDQAPWLRTLSKSEGDAATPALSPPRKSLPVPGRG